MNDLLLRALRCEEVDRPPVWLMRQAGRYLPEYQALRARYALKEMFSTPELAARVTLQPLQRFGMDAAILFSDILVIAEVFGLFVDFPQTGGPQITPLVKEAKDVNALVCRPVAETLGYVKKTIEILKPELKVPLVGFSGGPFTVASYFIEESGTEKLRATKKWMYSDPESFHALLEKITEASIAYLKMQEAAGVNAIQIFDSWAGMLSSSCFSLYALPYLKKMVEALSVPVVLFCRGSSLFAKELSALSPAGISFDWHQELAQLRREVPKSIAVQGNLDPDLLRAPLSVVEAETGKLLESMRTARGFVVNLGHGVLPDTRPEAVERLVQTVVDWK